MIILKLTFTFFTDAPSRLSMTSSPSDLTQQATSQVTLTCTADGGHPAPDITIYRHGVSKASGKSTAALTITLTKPDNQVALVCKATSAGITGQMSANEIKYDVSCKLACVSSFAPYFYIISVSILNKFKLLIY